MHKEILTKEQIKLLPLLGNFYKNFGMVGGTAIALHLGHRYSIDFDMFSEKKFGNKAILNIIEKKFKADKIIVDKLDEFTLIVNSVKFTFYKYPYSINYNQDFNGQIRLPDLLTLAAMKAFALGQRAKWKDYVDLYFIIKDYYSVDEISEKAKKLFEAHFNAKLFRLQLGYFEQINYNEQVEFLPGFEVPEKVIKKALVEFSVQ